jgi:hypothetical protein
MGRCEGGGSFDIKEPPGSRVDLRGVRTSHLGANLLIQQGTNFVHVTLRWIDPVGLLGIDHRAGVQYFYFVHDQPITAPEVVNRRAVLPRAKRSCEQTNPSICTAQPVQN